MAEQKELYEQYEEALCALLMNQIADAAGEELVQETACCRKTPRQPYPRKRPGAACIRSGSKLTKRSGREPPAVPCGLQAGLPSR